MRPLYIENLLHIGSEINPLQTLWYNGHIIGSIAKYYVTKICDEFDDDSVYWSGQLIVQFNSFFKMHTGQYDLTHLLVDSIEDLHTRLKEFNFTVLNNKKI